MKKYSCALIAIFILNTNCYAEGQDGITAILSLGYYIWALMCISLYTIIGGIVLKLFLLKFKLLVKNQTLKAFSISLFITIFLSVIYGKSFTFLIWDYL